MGTFSWPWAGMDCESVGLRPRSFESCTDGCLPAALGRLYAAVVAIVDEVRNSQRSLMRPEPYDQLVR